MTDRQNPAVTLRWIRQGTEVMLAAVDALSEEELREPSPLPGWSRAHVVAHTLRNAEALGRLAHWAATGDETPMYPSMEARSADIERTSQFDSAQLRSLLRSTAEHLDAQLTAFDAAAWNATVKFANGADIPGTEIAWSRVREIWLHGVDLGAAMTPDDFPAGVADAFLDEFVERLDARPDCPALVLVPTDRDRSWTLGSVGEPVEIGGPAAQIAAWLCGRSSDRLEPKDLPHLPAWS